MTKLCRAIRETELADLHKTGKFQASRNTLEDGKWFAETAQDAKRWAI
jgi:hypothetical protein